MRTSAQRRKQRYARMNAKALQRKCVHQTRQLSRQLRTSKGRNKDKATPPPCWHSTRADRVASGLAFVKQNINNHSRAVVTRGRHRQHRSAITASEGEGDNPSRVQRSDIRYQVSPLPHAARTTSRRKPHALYCIHRCKLFI